MSPGRICVRPKARFTSQIEERVVLEAARDGSSCGRLDALLDEELEGLVPAKIDLLAVPVGPRVGELPGELEEDTERALVALGLHVGRDARRVDGAIDALARAEEDPLAELVVRPPRRGQVDREIGDRRVRRRDGAADDSEDTDVRGEVPIRLFQQREGEIQLGLRDALAEIEVGSIGHVPLARAPRKGSGSSPGTKAGPRARRGQSPSLSRVGAGRTSVN